MTGRIDEFDSVALLAPIPADEIAVSDLPAGEGLKDGDQGVVMDAIYRDRGWVTVEFFRDGKTVAVTDVPLTRLRPHLESTRRYLYARASAGHG